MTTRTRNLRSEGTWSKDEFPELAKTTAFKNVDTTIFGTLWFAIFVAIPDMAYRILYKWGRNPDGEASFLADVDKINDSPFVDVKELPHQFWDALLFVLILFKPRCYAHFIHFADIRFLHWNFVAATESPVIVSKKLIQKVKDWCLAKGKTFQLNKATTFNTVLLLGRTVIHKVKHTSWQQLIAPTFIGCSWWIVGRCRFHITFSEIGDFSDAKVRLVFGMPFVVLMAEQMLFGHLFHLWKVYPPRVLAWGRSNITGLFREIDSSLTDGMTYCCIDYSGFDKTLQFNILIIILVNWFNNYFDYTVYLPNRLRGGKYSKYNPKSQRGKISLRKKMFSLLIWVIVHITRGLLALPTGELVRRLWACLPSGCFITQAVDSFYNALVIITILLTMGFKVRAHNFYLIVLGDDSLFQLDLPGHGYTQEQFIKEFSRLCYLHFGMIVNMEKSIITTDKNKIVFLGARNQNGQPVREPEEALAKCVKGERGHRAKYALSKLVGTKWSLCGTDATTASILDDAYAHLASVTKNADIEHAVALQDPAVTEFLNSDNTEGPLIYPSLQDTFKYSFNAKLKDLRGRRHDPNWAYDVFHDVEEGDFPTGFDLGKAIDATHLKIYRCENIIQLFGLTAAAA